MSRGDIVKDEEAVVRYASPRFVDNDLIDGGAFQLRASDHNELSVNLIGSIAERQATELGMVRAISRLTLRNGGHWAQLSAQAVREAFVQSSFLKSPSLIHDPLEATADYPEDTTHAVILNLPPVGSEWASLAGDLLAERIERVHPAL